MPQFFAFSHFLSQPPLTATLPLTIFFVFFTFIFILYILHALRRRYSNIFLKLPLLPKHTTISSANWMHPILSLSILTPLLLSRHELCHFFQAEVGDKQYPRLTLTLMPLSLARSFCILTPTFCPSRQEFFNKSFLFLI